jgi:hypothetical protein
LDKEFIFTRLDLSNMNDHIYLFIEFEQHRVDVKEDFPMGKVTLLGSDLKNTPIYTA